MAKISALVDGTPAVATDDIPVARTDNVLTVKVTAQSVADLRIVTAADVSSLMTGIGSRVKGLIGINNAVTPNTQYDLSADEVVLVNPSNGTSVVRFATGTVTNNISTVGPAANGRDQAAAFAANSWIHFWFIYNGTTPATLSSLSAIAPTLPSGYTHRAYCGAVRYNATPILLPVRFAGSLATYGIATGGEIRILASGVATTMTAVSAASYVPPNSRLALLALATAANDNSLVRYTMALRPTGAADAGQDYNTVVAVSTAVTVTTTTTFVPVSAVQSIDYAVVPAGSIGGFIDVYGYKMPNGGE